MSRLSQLPTEKSLVKESTVGGNPTMAEVVAGNNEKGLFRGESSWE